MISLSNFSRASVRPKNRPSPLRDSNMTKRLAIFCHYDKNNLIDDYVLFYLKDLKKVATKIHFVSNSPIEKSEIIKLETYVESITLRQNIGLDFGAWNETLYAIGLSNIANQYDELILANDSCYAPFSSFEQLFNRMSKDSCDMWGITENAYPEHTFENGETLKIAPHIQSYFLVFRKQLLQAQCFIHFWNSVDNFASRDVVITEYEAGLTQLLRQNNFICRPAFPCQENDLQNIKNHYQEQFYDLSIFYWHELLRRQNPLLKVKAIPATLRWNKKMLRKLSQTTQSKNDFCTFSLIDQHLYRTSEEYRFSKITSFKKICLLIQFSFKKNRSNLYAAKTFQRYSEKLKEKYKKGGVTLIVRSFLKKVPRNLFLSFY